MAKTIEITERKGLAIAAIMARKGIAGSALAAPLGLIPPEGPQTAGQGAMTLIGTGPGAWLAVAETDDADWIEGLRRSLAGLASVSEQSAAYTVLRISGPGARALLQKGCFIDLDPAVFIAGGSAVTAIAHIGVILWKLDDEVTFDVAVFRSLSGSFCDWITASLGHPHS